MNIIKIPVLIIVALLTVSLYASVYVVSEGHRALSLHMGKIVVDSATQQARVRLPGLHYQIPFVYQVRQFDIRIRTWLGKSAQIMTADKQEITANYYVKWQITDLSRYFTAVSGRDKRGQFLLEQQLNNDLRAQLGSRTLPEVLAHERNQLLDYLRGRLQQSAQAWGINIIDVQLMQIDPVNIYARMRVAQTQLANERRAEGKANAAAIRATATASAATVVTTAKEKAAQIRGEGDALAAKVYADAYGKSPEFFVFYRSLEAYKKVFANEQTILVVKPEGQFFKYFNNSQDRLAANAKH